jgi:hypothetical protein
MSTLEGLETKRDPEFDHCLACNHCRFAHNERGYCEQAIRRFGESDVCDCRAFKEIVPSK